MAASDPTPYVATPTGTLQGVAAFSWDGSAWQPSGRAGPDVATPTGVLQGVAPFAWDGSAWQPSGRAQPGVAAPGGVLDGVAVYTWSGSAWTPASGTATPSTPSGALRGIAAFSWDGAAWQPAAQARASVPTPYGVLDGVAFFNWGGTAWNAGAAVPAGATLDLSFLSGTLDPRITFTRASTATYFDNSGTMRTAASGAPRFDYDPVTHALRGLLIEEARTNLLLNSATLGTQSVTTTAVATTLSFYGTGTVTLSGTSTAGPLTGTGAANRVSLTFTPTAGTLTCTVTGSVLNAQVEAGAFATSYIPTTAATVTRAQEACSIPTTPWYDYNNVSLLFEMYQPVQPSGAVGGFGDGATFANSLYLASGTAFIRGGISQALSGPLVVGAVNKICGTLNSATIRCCTNAGAIGSVANTGGVAGAVTLLAFGGAPWAVGTGNMNGHIRRARYWPRVLSDAEMQSVTT